MFDQLLQALATIYGEDTAALKAALVTVNDEDKTETIAEGAADWLIAKDAERVRKLREGSDGGNDAKAKSFELKGRKEALEKLENEARQEFAYEGTEKGIALIRAIVADKAKSTLTDDQVKLHPLFIRREQELTQRIGETEAEFSKRLSEVENTYKRDRIYGRAVEKGLGLLDDARIIWHEKPEKALAAREDFAELLKRQEWEEVDGELYPVKDGKRMEDGHGNVKTFARFVRETADRRFEFQAQTPKGNGGNTNGGTGAPIGIPKTEEEYQQRWWEESDPVKQKQLEDAWEAAKKHKTN